MPQEVMSVYLEKCISKYRYRDLTKRDIQNAVKQYKNLIVKRDVYVYSDGTRKELACLDGTIPVRYKNAIYHIPVCIWLQDTHPYNSPMCYVKPTPDMLIKTSIHVDSSGRVYLPYLHAWNPDSSDILGLIQVMIIIFGEMPPVYTRPKVQQDSTYVSPPYPANPTSYMPMPGVGSPYPSYPPVSYPPTSNMPYQPPYPSEYPPAGGYPDYSGYNAASGAMPGTNNYPAATATGGYMPVQPPSITNASSQQNSTGTISEEHIHASLLSAVEDKLKKRLREVLAQAQAEIEVLKKTQNDLIKGKEKLEDMLNQLKSEQTDLEKNIHVLKSKEEEMSELLTKIENQEELDIDEAVVTTAPLYKQLLNIFAEENATEDAIYYLGEALRKGIIDLDLFLKHARQLSRKQFMLRALMQKCRQKANLPH